MSERKGNRLPVFGPVVTVPSMPGQPADHYEGDDMPPARNEDSATRTEEMELGQMDYEDVYERESNAKARNDATEDVGGTTSGQEAAERLRLSYEAAKRIREAADPMGGVAQEMQQVRRDEPNNVNRGAW